MRSKLLFRIEDNPGDFGLTQWALEKTNILTEPVIVGNGEKTPDDLFGSFRFANRRSRQMTQTEC